MKNFDKKNHRMRHKRAIKIDAKMEEARQVEGDVEDETIYLTQSLRLSLLCRLLGF